VYGSGIDMWLRSPGEKVQVVGEYRFTTQRLKGRRLVADV